MRPPSLLLRALLGLLLLAYTLLFGEVFVRVMRPQALVPRFVTGGADGIRANIPNAAYTQTTPEVTARIAYNSQGLRADHDYAVPKPAGTCRIALLGDSFFAGFEASLQDSFGGQLEAQLRQAGKPCEVLNFAVSGFGTAEALVALKSRVKPFAPDVLIVSWQQTDPEDNRRSRLYRWDGTALEPTGRAYLPGVEVSDFLMRFAAYRWALEHSHLYTAAREWVGVTGKRIMSQLARLEDHGARPAAAAESTARAPSAASADTLDVALIAAIDAEMARQGGKLLVFDIPRSLGRQKLQSALDLLPPSAPQRFAVASPLSLMQAHAGPDVKLYWEQGQGHWTPLGNRLAAKAAVDAMLARGWLGAGTAPACPAEPAHADCAKGGRLADAASTRP